MSKVVLLSDDKRGLSMIEQLIPEMTTHVLSFLDYSSLCSLSMTSSLMSKAANDDNHWKSLYYQDFTEEKCSVSPINGWKAYYAATKTLRNANSEFFEIMAAKSLHRMRRLWLNANHVMCFHDSGEVYSGAFMQSVQGVLPGITCESMKAPVVDNLYSRLEYLFNSWEFWFDFDAFDVEARVLTDTPWVSMFTSHHVAVDGPLLITNVFELHNNRWFMVYHYCSIVPMAGAENNEQVGFH